MKALALVLVALLAVSDASSLRTRLAAKYSPYGDGVYDSQPAQNMYDGQRFQQTWEDPAADQAAAEQQAEQQQAVEPAPEAAEEPALKPAIVEGGEQTGEGAVLPPEPELKTPGEEESEEDDSVDTEETDPEAIKLGTALEAVKEDIVATTHQIADERKWVAAVIKITSSYEEKIKKVQSHILLLREQVAKLFKKKKQIENLKLQRALEGKLRQANEELETLQTSLKAVQEKHESLDKSHMDLRSTIVDIEKQLGVLKGEDPAKAEEEEKAEIKEAVEADELEESSSKEAAELLAAEEKKDTFLA